MKPPVSEKDDPVKQIRCFSFYLDPRFKRNVFKNGLYDYYKQACADAYNKIKDLDKRHVLNPRYDFEQMQKRLLMNFVERKI